MNLGGIYQLDKDTDASFQDGSDKEDDDTSVESDSSSVDDTDLAAGAILVPDFKNNPDQDDIFATPWGKEHYLKYFPRQTRPLIGICHNDVLKFLQIQSNVKALSIQKNTDKTNMYH